ncbi:MAG: hypothetical protein K2Y37_06685 [Pirellulales bacterium]|nr:hypothetical protein [Pirellulales bacterium]
MATLQEAHYVTDDILAGQIVSRQPIDGLSEQVVQLGKAMIFVAATVAHERLIDEMHEAVSQFASG